LSLLELVVAMALSSLLVLGMVHMAMAARGSFRLQEGLAELQENSRYFADLISVSLTDSAYHPQPWLHDATPIGLMDASVDASAANSDRLVSRSWSDRNCFGSLNNDLDGSGQPRFYLREFSVELNAGSLAQTCRYGPDAATLTTQVNRQGAIPEVEVFQVLYAVDGDGDGTVERWSQAGDWDHPGQVRAVRMGLLARSREGLAGEAAPLFQVLDFDYQAPADGRLRRVINYTLPLHRLRP
jgi:hypothetical protein